MMLTNPFMTQPETRYTPTTQGNVAGGAQFFDFNSNIIPVANGRVIVAMAAFRRDDTTVNVSVLCNGFNMTQVGSLSKMAYNGGPNTASTCGLFICPDATVGAGVTSFNFRVNGNSGTNGNGAAIALGYMSNVKSLTPIATYLDTSVTGSSASTSLAYVTPPQGCSILGAFHYTPGEPVSGAENNGDGTATVINVSNAYSNKTGPRTIIHGAEFGGSLGFLATIGASFR